MAPGTGTPMAFLRDFKLATGDYHIRDPRLVNLAGLNRYLWHKIFYNNGEKSIQGGDEIDYSLFFDDGGTWTHSLPAMFRQWKRVDNAYRAATSWREAFDHKTWIRAELMRNSKFKYGNRAAKFDVLFDMDMKLEQRMQTSIANGLEDDLAAVPHFDEMESPTNNSAKLPWSLFAHVNQDAYGLYGRYVNTTALDASPNTAVTGGTWTQKQRIDPSASYTSPTIVTLPSATTIGIAQSKYSPRVSTYSSSAVNSPANIFAAIRELWRMCSWEGPSMTRQWFENSNFNNLRVLWSSYGLRVIESLILEGQDRFVIGPQDFGVPDPQVYGVPMKWWPKLDTAPIYDTGHDATGDPTGKTTEGQAVIGGGGVGAGRGPRGYFVNFNSLYPVVHDEMWMFREAMDPHFNIPDVFVEYVECWHNLLNEDYRQHGVVAPIGSVYGPY